MPSFVNPFHDNPGEAVRASIRMVALVGWGVLGLLAGQAHAQTLDMTWKPVSDANGEVFAIAVRQHIDSAGPGAEKPLSFIAPIVYAAVTGVADRIQNLQVRDAAGPVTLEVDDDTPASGGLAYYRHWRVTREISYPVTVSYVAFVQPPGSPNGPAFGIRPAEGGISGAGAGFLLLPENAGTTLTRLDWDLTAMPAGAIGVTTFGEGRVEVSGSPDAINAAWLMAGPLHRFASAEDTHFKAYWLGTPTFDPETEMAWAARGYGALTKAYKYLDPAPDYRVFMRVLDTPPYGGGTALGNSFLFSMAAGKVRDRQTTRITIFHEMGHQWVGGYEGGMASAWFTEGLNVYYTTVLPVRAGLLTVDEYGTLLNQQAKDYYTSPALRWSAAKIAQSGFTDELVRHEPYNRGQLYFADLDAQIRKASHGKRSLDLFLAPLFKDRQTGIKIDQAYWENLLKAELGQKAVDAFRAINIDGTWVIDPATTAWGPCFKRKATPMKSGDETVTGYQWVRTNRMPSDKCTG